MGRQGKVTQCEHCGHDKVDHGERKVGTRAGAAVIHPSWCSACHGPCEFTPRIGRPPIEGEKTVTRSYSMLPGEHAMVADLAKEWGCSASAALSRVIREKHTSFIRRTKKVLREK